MASSKYKQLFRVVQQVIDEWDPYDLIAGGAPKDEWNGEIAAIAAQVPRIESPHDAAQAISQVFSSSLHPEGFSPDDCAEVGERLFGALRRARIIPDSAVPNGKP